MRSLALTPTWSVASVLTIFVAVSLIVERSIHRLCNWLRETNRKPLLETVEKMKEELMLLGFISLLLTATSSTIANICIPSKFYEGHFAPCTRSEIDEGVEHNSSEGRKLEMLSVLPHPLRRMLNGVEWNPCEKIHSWRAWEELARMDCHDALTEKTLRRQTTFVRHHASSPLFKNSFLIWVSFLKVFKEERRKQGKNRILECQKIICTVAVFTVHKSSIDCRIELYLN